MDKCDEMQQRRSMGRSDHAIILFFFGHKPSILGAKIVATIGVATDGGETSKEADDSFFYFYGKFAKGECLGGLFDIIGKEQPWGGTTLKSKECITIDNQTKSTVDKCDEMQRRRSMLRSDHAIIVSKLFCKAIDNNNSSRGGIRRDNDLMKISIS
ncbi:hypothetical protein IEQ34_005263 [Dendrobium chrysotoxum]|uniref:Uncharacterized protein n=1 Tax=Dendrobium chrysotoxum TaxID=161865 RepID=A0AAV7HAL1_DENCH|nr:hypothetical protein IEQ34_005263 [Dendrobium chrysotoxum]